MNKLSVVVNVVDEELEWINSCLSSVIKLKPEIILVDMTTGDDLQKVAKKFGANLHKLKRASHVEVARNFGLSKASKEWILILDPDEALPRTLAKKN